MEGRKGHWRAKSALPYRCVLGEWERYIVAVDVATMYLGLSQDLPSL
jgi:hypothetical protein